MSDLEIIKLLEKNRKKPLTLVLAIFGGNMSAQIRATKAKIQQMGLHQTKKLLHMKENHQENEETTILMGKIFANDGTFNKALISKIYKELTHLSIKK